MKYETDNTEQLRSFNGIRMADVTAVYPQIQKIQVLYRGSTEVVPVVTDGPFDLAAIPSSEEKAVLGFRADESAICLGFTQTENSGFDDPVRRIGFGDSFIRFESNGTITVDTDLEAPINIQTASSTATIEATQSIPENTPTRVQLDTSFEDRSVVLENNQFIIPFDGVYELSGRTAFENIGQNNTMYTAIYVNNTEITKNPSQSTVNQELGSQVSTYRELEKNDTVSLYTYQNSQQNRDLQLAELSVVRDGL